MQNRASTTDVKHTKTNVDYLNNATLHRALSTVSENQRLVNTQRNILAKNYRRTSINDEIVTIDHHDADALFILPNLYEFPEDIHNSIMDNLVDIPTMAALEETKRLNWWIHQKLPYPKLYPLVTSGDGNCLLHATSLAMWGFHDHALSMRKALNETLITSKPNSSLYRRWRWTQSVQNKKYGLVFSEQEWDEEWQNLLRLSSIEPRISQIKNSSTDEMNDTKSNAGDSIKGSSQSIAQFYESLEEFHVYVLANNIRRPIIIYSDTILRTNNGEAISPVEFGGIYLPLEIPPDKCSKQPIFLSFDTAHFSALVSIEAPNITYRIPIIDFETFDLLPIHFIIDPGVNFPWPIDEELSDVKIDFHTNSRESRIKILEKYLNLSKECFSLNNLISSSTSSSSITTSTSVSDNQTSLVNTTNTNVSNEIHSKKSRSSLNSFSKMIRRRFFEPFSSTKRTSIKYSQPTSSISNEISSQHRKSTPLLNRHTNILTIVSTIFQPKRPKTSDNMIKNYINSYINEYNSKQIHDNNENLSSIFYSRHHLSSSKINTNRQELNLMNKLLPTLDQHSDSDDNDDLFPIETQQFSSNINYIQRKPNQLTQNYHHPESHRNGTSNKSSSYSPSSQKILSSSSNHQQLTNSALITNTHQN